MYIIIAGCGSVGANLADKLLEAGHNVVVIDPDEEDFDQLGSGFNCITITGSPIDEDVLKAGGIETADALLAVTKDDNMNIMVSQIAKQLYNVPNVITRINDPKREEVFHIMGLDVISPTKLAVDAFFDHLVERRPN